MNDNHHIRISILIPIYGVERYIVDCAQSLFTQTLREGVEFIFVNDATPDGSIALLRQILEKHPSRADQVAILDHPTNQGLAAARRTAIDAARGEWILHVDSDDVLLPTAAEHLLSMADTTDADLIFGGYFSSDNPAHDPVNPHTTTNIPTWSRTRLLRSLVAQSHRITNRTWGVLIRRSLCTEHNIYPIEGINFAEDYAVMPRLLHAARHIAILHETIYGYRLASDGSYMKRLDARAATQYIAANHVVTDYLKQQPDYPALRQSVILGRLNIQKWIIKRGLDPKLYEAQLFDDGDRPRQLTHHIYMAAIHSGSPILARIAGLMANLFN